MHRREAQITLAALGLGALLYGLFKTHRFWRRSSPPPTPNQETLSDSKSTHSQEDQQEHLPYEFIIEDMHRSKMGSGRISHLPNIKDINYRIILSLTKGNSYQGIVITTFQLDGFPYEQDQFFLNFNGSGVKYVMVNGRELDSTEVVYLDHKIQIPTQLLKKHGKNSIQVIFENQYSFLGNGLSTYFVLGDRQKYLLRQQLIYCMSGYLQIEKVIPCINCLNPCKVQVQTIHPDKFEMFSTTSKSLQRYCSVVQYHKYSFLFNVSNKLIASPMSNNSDAISQQSTLTNSYGTLKKANTNFHLEHLLSIHNLFILSSALVELQPTPITNAFSEQILISYFSKHAEAHRFVKSVNTIHGYIMDVLNRLGGEQVKQYITKIDVVIINDNGADGYFAPGIILLSEQSMEDESVGIQCLYLIVRALMGMLQLKKGYNVITLQQILSLNQMVFSKFEQFRNFLFIKNQKYDKVRAVINSCELKQYLSEHQGHFLQYYSKEMRFILAQNNLNSLSFEFKNIMLSFRKTATDQFWQNLLSNSRFLSPLITEPLVKLAISQLAIPTNPLLLHQLKLTFASSKYILSFYTNEEISAQLPLFIEQRFHGLELRLTQFRVKQKFQDAITDKYQKYVLIKQNEAETEAIYNKQFKKFNEEKNFHHISLLKTEMKRVAYFRRQSLTTERVDIECSITAWKLLHKLKIYPADEDYYRLIKNIDQVQQ